MRGILGFWLGLHLGIFPPELFASRASVIPDNVVSLLHEGLPLADLVAIVGQPPTTTVRHYDVAATVLLHWDDPAGGISVRANRANGVYEITRHGLDETPWVW